jgi:hypothetical protein
VNVGMLVKINRRKQMINLKKNNMSDRTFVVERIDASDRNIAMHFVNNQLVGVNFWQGADDLLPNFIDRNPRLYNYLYQRFIHTDWWFSYEEFQFLHNSPDYWDILKWIDDRIWDYVNIAMRIEELESEIKKLKEQL